MGLRRAQNAKHTAARFAAAKAAPAVRTRAAVLADLERAKARVVELEAELVNTQLPPLVNNQARAVMAAARQTAGAGSKGVRKAPAKKTARGAVGRYSKGN